MQALLMRIVLIIVALYVLINLYGALTIYLAKL